MSSLRRWTVNQSDRGGRGAGGMRERAADTVGADEMLSSLMSYQDRRDK